MKPAKYLSYLLTASFIIIQYSMSYGQFKIPTINLPKNIPNPTKSTSLQGLSESDIIAGLKEALSVGSKNASSQLNRLDGFNKNMRIRIPFPEDAQRVATKLRQLGYGKKVDEFELTLNRAAEQAAKEAAPIFVGAIKQMTFADAKSILTGADTAATGYLRKTTFAPLYNSFAPHVTKALGNTFATSKWTEITKIYNRLPMVKKVDTDLTRYTTNKALKGLFVVVADEELKIRKDPAARVTDILRKVFGQKS